MASERARLIAHRLYLTAFWPLVAVLVASLGWTMVTFVHDHWAARDASECMGAKIDALNAEQRKTHPDLERYDVFITDDEIEVFHKACGVELYFGDAVATRAWTRDFSYLKKDAATGHLLGSMVLASIFGVPLVLLIAIRRWLVWLLAPPKGEAGPPAAE